MSDEINVVSRTQTLIVDPASQSVSIINAGALGPAGPPGPEGPLGPIGPAGLDEVRIGGTAPVVAGTQLELWVDESEPTIIPTMVIGMVIDFAGPILPSLWLFCDGKEYSRATYPLLDAVISTTYGAYTNGSGAAGSTHFRTPDLRGRITVAVDNMGGADAGRLDVSNILGVSGGAATHVLTETEMPSHTHPVYAPSGHTWGVSYGGVSGSITFIFQPYQVNGGTYAGSPLAAYATGGGAAHNNMPPYMLINKLIYAGQ